MLYVILITTAGNQLLIINNRRAMYLEIRCCTTVQNSDDQARTPICVLSATVASGASGVSARQDHNWIRNISASTASAAAAHQDHH